MLSGYSCGMRKMLPPQTYLRECFDYSADVKGLIWKKRPEHHFATPINQRQWNTKFAGKRAGSACAFRRAKQSVRYTAVKLFGELFFEHHLVLAWHGLKCPQHLEVDHIDDDPTNNSMDNLRPVTRSVNCRKAAQPSKMGVRKIRAQWEARITVEGKRQFLGAFPTYASAVSARRAAAEQAAGNPTLWERCEKEARP